MSERYPEAAIFGTEIRNLTSSIVGQDYQLSVWRLPDYSSSEKAYPVLYVLDGNFSMGMATDIARWLVFAKEIPEIMIVGVGQPIHSYEEFGNNRNRDYSPITHPDLPGSGGAPRFLAFLENELIPFVDANYRTDPANRSIWGYSFSGLFAIYALLHKPDLFQRYIAGSPSLSWCEQAIFSYENALAERQSALPANVYISLGSLEDIGRTTIDEFARLLRSRNYEGLNLQTEILDGETHFSGFARSFIRGVKTIY